MSLEIVGIRQGKLPNPNGEYPCSEAGCECRFFTRLDWLLHRKRGQHGQMNFMDTFRRIRGNYAGARPKEQAYARQSRLQLIVQGTSLPKDINSTVPHNSDEPQ
jgi:hypothetical protein